MLKIIISVMLPMVLLCATARLRSINEVLATLALLLFTEAGVLWLIGQQLFSTLLLLVYVGAVLVLLLVTLTVLRPEPQVSTPIEIDTLFTLSLFGTFIFLIAYDEITTLVGTLSVSNYANHNAVSSLMGNYGVSPYSCYGENAVDQLAFGLGGNWQNVLRSAFLLLIAMVGVITIMVSFFPQQTPKRILGVVKLLRSAN